MDDELLFATDREFMAWMQRTKDSKRYRYARITETCGLHLRVSQPLGSHGDLDLVFVPIDLPSPDRAQEWWDKLMDANVCEYWMARIRGQDTILVAARNGLWKPQDTPFAELGARHFQPVWAEDLRQYIDTSTEGEMANEVRFIGFSVRRVMRGEQEQGTGGPHARRSPRKR